MKVNIKCVIVDDEPPALRILENYIQQIPSLELVFSTTKPLEVIAFLEKEACDLIIMDIQMPTITGVQLSKIIDNKIKIIFTTAYSEFAVESYNLNVLDYLLKPFEFERLFKAIKKLDDKPAINLNHANNYVFIKKDSKHNFEKILISDILYVEGLKNYVAIHTISKNQIITYNTLKSINNNLPSSQFVQIHKSYIISLTNIYKTNTNSVELNGNVELPIGNTFKSNFFRIIDIYKL